MAGKRHRTVDAAPAVKTGASAGAKGGTKAAKAPGSLGWKVFRAATTMVVVRFATAGLDAAWRAATGKKPPSKPSKADSRTEALLWAGLSGATVAVAHSLGALRSRNQWIAANGELPPDEQTDR